MITGTYINAFALNGTSIAFPTDHHWVEREPVGIDGNGIAVYPAVREYEIVWDFLDTEEWQTVYNIFIAQGVTGTVVSALPQWNTTPYQFYSYSGTIMRELKYDNWFQNFYVNVKLLICRILTT